MEPSVSALEPSGILIQGREMVPNLASVSPGLRAKAPRMDHLFWWWPPEICSQFFSPHVFLHNAMTLIVCIMCGFLQSLGSLDSLLVAILGVSNSNYSACVFLSLQSHH